MRLLLYMASIKIVKNSCFFLSPFPFSVTHIGLVTYTLGGASITSSLYLTFLSQVYHMVILSSLNIILRFHPFRFHTAK